MKDRYLPVSLQLQAAPEDLLCQWVKLWDPRLSWNSIHTQSIEAESNADKSNLHHCSQSFLKFMAGDVSKTGVFIVWHLRYSSVWIQKSKWSGGYPLLLGLRWPEVTVGGRCCMQEFWDLLAMLIVNIIQRPALNSEANLLTAAFTSRLLVSIES